MTEQDRIHVAAGVGAIGGLVMLVAEQASGSISIFSGAGPDMLMLASAAIGAFGAGLLTGDLFGQQGYLGAALAVAGSVLSTLLGSAIGGSMALVFDNSFMGGPLSGLVLGPAYVLMAFGQSVEALTTWVACFALLNQGVKAMRSGGWSV